MPPRPRAASCRLYRAFYEWTVLTSSPGASASSGCRHDYHSTSPVQEGLRFRMLHPGRQQKKPDGPSTSRTQADPLNRREATPKRNDKSRLEDESTVPEAWRKGPVLTAAEKPFNSLSEYDVVVRYRSDSGIMVEMAVPQHDLKRMQRALGNSLKVLSKKTGAVIEVQQPSAPNTIADVEDARIVSVLVSGSFIEALNAVRHTSAYRGRNAFKTTDAQSVPKAFSHTLRPSATLTHKEFVWRQITKTSASMELSVPESQFKQFVASSSIEEMAKNYGVHVEVGEPELRPVDKRGSQIATARSFLISGPRGPASRATFHFLKCISGRNEKHARLLENGGKAGTPSLAQADAASLDSKRPQKLQAQSLSGVFAEDYQVCSATIVGQSSASLRDMLVESSGPLENLTAKLSLHSITTEPTGEIVATGTLPMIERFQRELSSTIKNLCTSQELGNHDLEFDVKPLRDTLSQRKDLVTCQPDLLGPQSERLWSLLRSELVEGWCSYGGSFCRVGKTENALTLMGPHQMVLEVTKKLRRRMHQLCTSLGYSLHDLSLPLHLTDPAKTAELVDNVRHALRALTHPVVLITAQHSPGREHKDRGFDARGATVSSFATVTLTPQPIVSFNLKLPSRTWDAIKESSKFNAHFLSATPRGAAIADTFTRTYSEHRSGFVGLNEMGIFIRYDAHGLGAPVVLDSAGGGIHALLSGRVMLEKCVEVEDHVIVVGRVSRFRGPRDNSDSLALSYANRGYRDSSGRIEPDFTQSTKKAQSHDSTSFDQSGGVGVDYSLSQSQPARYDELDPLRLGEDNKVEAEERLHSPSWDRGSSESLQDHDDLDDPVYKALAFARDEVRREEEADHYEALNTQTQQNSDQWRSQEQLKKDAKRATMARQEEEEYDFGFGEPDHQAASSGHDSIPSARGVQSPSSRRKYSTFARPLAILPRSTLPPYRLASTAATSKPSRDISGILDPATAQSTVADYLSLSDNTYDEEGKFCLYIRQNGVRGSLAAKQDIVRLKALLARGFRVSQTGEDISLTPEQISNIQQKITLCERKVCINLAVNAMRSLRDMLDKARYGELFWRRVPLLESLVEQGMATLMQEARELRSTLDAGNIDRERYDKVSETMKWKYDAMGIEVGRLRQVTEEEGDGGVKSFDDDGGG